MSAFVVHTIIGSPFGRSVIAALIEKSAPWRLAPISPGAHTQAPHTERHPFARVPVLEDGDFRIYETQAILRYIDRIVPEPALTPADPRAAARMDLLMSVNDWYLFQGVGNAIGFQRVILPRLTGAAPNEEVIAKAMPKARTVFKEIARQLGEHAFLTGEALSLADLHIAPQMAILAEAPEWATLTENLPNLVSWLARMEARPSFVATTWAHLAEQAQAA